MRVGGGGGVGRVDGEDRDESGVGVEGGAS